MLYVSGVQFPEALIAEKEKNGTIEACIDTTLPSLVMGEKQIRMYFRAMERLPLSLPLP